MNVMNFTTYTLYEFYYTHNAGTAEGTAAVSGRLRGKCQVKFENSYYSKGTHSIAKEHIL